MDEVSKVAPEDARRLIDEGAQVIDVRADHEWEAGRIAGASHVELATLPSRTGDIDRDRPVVVYCRGGSRSEMAAEALGGEGFDAVVLDGGFPAWLDDGGPAEPEGAYAAESGEAAAILQARKSPGPGR
jgi:rhodanese-related sulfurtransferase